MTLWILDTDHVSLFQTGHPSVTKKIQSTSPNSIFVTIITLEEQMYGRLNQVRKAKSLENLTAAYLNLNFTLNYFQTINVLDFDQKAATCYQEITNQKIRVGTQDLRKPIESNNAATTLPTTKST
jgi:tRNA(fMet)-specific endonuclease VapC